MDRSSLQRLLRKYLDGKASATEIAFLEEYYREAGQSPDAASEVDHAEMQLHKKEIIAKLSESLNDIPETRVHRIPILKTAWFRYAAAIIVIFGIASYVWVINKDSAQPPTATLQQPSNIVPPGGNKAILTLANGTRIVLDNAENGTLAQQGNTQVVKLANGNIKYDSKGVPGNSLLLNTMSTPAGGQYQLTLPDGTKVWLNAASSITYPVSFGSTERLVKISGEAYFEVARDKTKPFVVDIDGKSTVQVVGTTFNINSYQNEGSVKTTLVEGKVKVFNAPAKNITPGTYNVVMKPGQQATIAESIVIASKADMDQALAWKNGLFSFNGTDLKGVMRQMERWYDISVKYENNVPDITLKGKMYRNVNLSVLLEFLKKMGLKFRVEGRTLIVM